MSGKQPRSTTAPLPRSRRSSVEQVPKFIFIMSRPSLAGIWTTNCVFCNSTIRFVGSNFIVMELLEEEPGLFALLEEAVRPLQIAFGDKRIFQARVRNSDDERLLKIAVQLPADLGGLNPEQALASFDTEWWLNNCHRSRGVLVFDYEIQDAV